MMNRPEGCLSDFAFDRWLAGELDDVETAATAAHVTTCARCTAREAELRAQQADFAATAPPFVTKPAAAAKVPVLGRLARLTPGRMIAAGGSALAAAAALVIFVSGRAPAEDGAPAQGIRFKGGEPHFGYYVSHAGAVRLAAEAEVVEPGDALRFEASSPAPTFFAVFSLDGARTASVYFPPDAQDPYALPAGVDTALPASTVLDEVLGPETLFGVFCTTPFDLRETQRQLAQAGRLPERAGCTVVTLQLTKTAHRRP